MNWSEIRHFSPKEFDCPGVPGSGLKMDLDFVARLDRLREACGFAFKIRSGYRTPAHNARVGGVNDSAHEHGLAADIQAESGTARFVIVREALKIGFRRIGVGATFVHLDMDESKPQSVLWTYPVG